MTFAVAADEMSVLFADEEMLILLSCGQRDSRDRCLRDQTAIGVFVRNASLPSDAATMLTSLRLDTCILTDDIQRLVRHYTAALRNGIFCRTTMYVCMYVRKFISGAP